MAKKYFIYVFSSLFIFFSELGSGFTSFNASFVFNQGFVNIANLKLIEFVVAGSYICLLSTKKASANLLKRERTYAIAFICLLICLLIVEFFLHDSVNISDWRNVLVGIIIFHIFSLTLTTEESIISFLKFFIIALGIKSAIGLGAYLVGHGVVSPRGSVPFFWDSKQVDAFSYASIILTSYIASYKDIKPNLRIIKMSAAILILFIFLITILLSIRRTIWVITFLGIIAALILSNRINVKHYIIGIFAAFTLSVIILAAPQFEKIRDKLSVYVVSMNLFDDKISKSIDNDVHIDNLEKYTQIISDNPSIFMFGYRGYSGSEYKNLPQKYSDKYPLGVAHNGVLRSIYFFGIGGVIIFILFVLDASTKYFKIKSYNDNYLMKHVAIASILWLFLSFFASLFYIPPFWTTFKGVFYTFIAIYFIRSGIYYYNSNTSSDDPIEELTPDTGTKFNECKLR
ncbi:MAG: hypothetical protein QM504_01215 [Pseudomonadota bacterium]